MVSGLGLGLHAFGKKEKNSNYKKEYIIHEEALDFAIPLLHRSRFEPNMKDKYTYATRVRTVMSTQCI